MSVSTSTSSGTSSSQKPGHHLFPAGQLVPFILVTVLFFLWGIPNNLNDVLIRQFMKSFAISRFQAGLVQFAFYMGYFVLAVIGGSLLVMAIVGGAALTPLMGWISERFHSIALAYSVPLVAYIFIAFYSFLGSKPREHVLT